VSSRHRGTPEDRRGDALDISIFEKEVTHGRKEVPEQIGFPGPPRPRQHDGGKALYGLNQLPLEASPDVSHD
jgi:hypothetical protein